MEYKIKKIIINKKGKAVIEELNSDESTVCFFYTPDGVFNKRDEAIRLMKILKTKWPANLYNVIQYETYTN